MSAEIEVAVDLTNPGQYFACCGLLELAHRMWPGAEGWFEGGVFHVRAAGGGEELWKALRDCEIANTMTGAQKRRRQELGEMGQRAWKADPALEEEKKALDALWRKAPVRLGEPFGFRVDWFLDDRSGGAALKTWAGKQAAVDTVETLRALLPEAATLDAPALTDRVPFYFDSNVGGVGDDIDVGFSFDPLKDSAGLRVAMQPAIELLAFVGLQRFRPVRMDKVWEYSVWQAASSAELAALICCGVVQRRAERRFRFGLVARTDYTKSFLPGRPV